MEVLPQILRYALPVLVAIALLEALLFWLFSKHGGKPYPWRETFASLGVALGQKLKQILLGGVIISLFLGLWSKRLWTVPLDTVWGLLLLFVAVEFVYYWHHRLSHEIRWLWATHAVHHSATHLNFAAALRLGWTGEISGGALLFFPLVLAGFHPIGMMAALALICSTSSGFTANGHRAWAGWRACSIPRPTIASIMPRIRNILIKIMVAC